MATTPVSGTEGYAEQAETLLRRYESFSFADVHRPVIELLPKAPGRVLDIGSGTGRDAAALAAMGHQVVAVEPTAALRAGAMALHPSPEIEWLDDSLPDLALVRGRGERFDAIMLTAVWMHLDPVQRRRAMPVIAALIRPGGVIAMSLRHGPVPRGRRMFEVGAEETIELAQQQGLQVLLDQRTRSDLLSQVGVTWTRLVLTMAAAPARPGGSPAPRPGAG